MRRTMDWRWNLPRFHIHGGTTKRCIMDHRCVSEVYRRPQRALSELQWQRCGKNSRSPYIYYHQYGHGQVCGLTLCAGNGQLVCL